MKKRARRARPRARMRLDTPERRRGIVELVEHVLTWKDWDPVALAMRLDVSEAAVRGWMAGQHAPQAEQVRALHALLSEFGVARRSPRWTLKDTGHIAALHSGALDGTDLQSLWIGGYVSRASAVLTGRPTVLEVERQSNGALRVSIGGGRWTFVATPGQNGKWDVTSCEDT
jgi:hypothetical protein